MFLICSQTAEFYSHTDRQQISLKADSTNKNVNPVAFTFHFKDPSVFSDKVSYLYIVISAFSCTCINLVL